MRLDEKEMPVVLQAYETSDREERFIAEQVVHTQVEADGFTSRFSGLLIKSRPVNETETAETVIRKRRTRSSASIWIFVVVLIIVLALIGYYTGWIQSTFNWNI